MIGKIKKEKQSDFKLITKYKHSFNYGVKYQKLSLSDKVVMAIELHKCLEIYYGALMNVANTKQYIADFDNWCNAQGINPNLISDTKKIDFWMWLA